MKDEDGFFADVLRRANQKGRKGSYDLRHHQAFAEIYAEAILPIEAEDEAYQAPRKLVEGVALAVRLGRKKDGKEPLQARRKPELFYGRVAEGFQSQEELRSVLSERVATRAYLVHLSEESFAAAQACFHTAVEETQSPPAEPFVLQVREEDLDDDGVQEVLTRPLESKVLIISRRSVENGDIRRAVRFFDMCGADRKAALANVGRVVVFVEGYDQDPRELWQIPQARQFFARLWQAVPHLLFFLLPEGPPGQVGSAMFLVTMLHPEPSGRGSSESADSRWRMVINWRWVGEGFLEKGFLAMNAFAARHGIVPSDAAMRSLVARITNELIATRDGSRLSLVAGTQRPQEVDAETPA
jgi:hypothetical protein